MASSAFSRQPGVAPGASFEARIAAASVDVSHFQYTASEQFCNYFDVSQSCDATGTLFGLLTGSLSDKITGMRLNETQIKETILHPNSEVRVKAIN